MGDRRFESISLQERVCQPSVPEPAIGPGTGSSNPVPSSRESVSLRISPAFLTKPTFSASLGTMPGGTVGRDAQSRAISSRGVVVSLSSYFPAPECSTEIANPQGSDVAYGQRRQSREPNPAALSSDRL